MHRGIGLIAFDGLAKVLFSQLILTQLEIGPAEGVKVGAVHWFEFDGFADHLQRFGEAVALVSKHVPEVVKDSGVIGVEVESLVEVLFCRI